MVATATATMTDLRPYPIMCTIAGHPTDVTAYSRSHGVDQPVATGSITLPLPLPEHLRGGEPGDVLNLPISMQVGYRESVLRPVFNGYIRRDRMELSRNGYYATLSMVGYATLLAWPESRDLEFSGNILLEEIIRSLCVRRGVPKYRIDQIMTPSGTRIRMGGNANIDDGKVIIPAGTSPLDWMTRLLRHFGYRAFDTAQEFRVQRVSGRPTLGPMGDFAEGKLIHRISRDRDLDEMVTAFTVEGATYTDDDGIQIPIRSIPAGTVPFEPLLNPPGYREQTIRENQLVTQVNADAVRQIAEIDHAAVNPTWSINTRGNSLYRPGATVRIASSTMEAGAENYWLMTVRDSLDARQGYKAVLTAWKGGGTALPDGDDLQVINARTAPVHLGDEHIPWYAQPAPSGKTFSIPITVPDTFTSLAISLYLHGSNNYLLGAGNTESSVSKIEVWQNGEEVGSTELPVVAENYEQRLPYGSGLTHWEQFRLPVPGRLEAGSAEIRIVSGEDTRLPSHTRWDDFEARDIRLELRGAGAPELPAQGVN